jgi:hypothetical protein
VKYYEIVYVFGHYEAINQYGKFICSGDTLRECDDAAEATMSEENAA